MYDYDIVTINHSESETKIWLHYIRKNCPGANVILLNDTKPFPRYRCSGKMGFLAHDKYKTQHIIYLDTDTVVFKDLGFVFDEMNDNSWGCSTVFAATDGMFFYNKGNRRQDAITACEYYDIPIEKLYHPLTGMLVFKNIIRAFPEIYTAWYEAFKLFKVKNLFEAYPPIDEAAFFFAEKLALPENSRWDIPAEIHNNLAKCKEYKHRIKPPFYTAAPIPPWPAVLHYHKPIFLNSVGFGYLLNVD